ncbi:GNAT family N-acetyltransferase [Nocardioides sp. CCNWLW212]
MARVDEVTLRSAVDDDAEALVAFWAFAGENESRPTDRPEMITGLLARDPSALLLATVDGEIVGTVIAGWDGWRAHLYRLAVRPDHRRRGLGRLLVERAEERLRALGAGRFDAMVLEGNELGDASWRAAGYTRQDDWRRWFRPSGG